MYENWQIAKSVINYRGEDETKQAEAQAAQNQYTTVAKWCNEGKEYHIEDDDEYYRVIKNPEPTAEELAEREINELKTYLTATDYVVIKIAEGSATVDEYEDVLNARAQARARINELE